MHLQTHLEQSQGALVREANFLSLRQIESILPSHLFQEVLRAVNQEQQFPTRMDWMGCPKEQSFEELKANFSQVDQNYLPKLVKLGTQNQISQIKNQNKGPLLDGASDPKPSIMTRQELSCHQVFEQMKRNKNNGGLINQKTNYLNLQPGHSFERMKTVMGHAALDKGEMTPVYNVLFDKEGKFIITGADDGIIKIWDKDSMHLQASLHGHMDYITDLDISPCNKYLVSSDKEGSVIIWDFKQCTIIDRLLPANEKQVTNVKFFSFKLKEEHGSSSSLKNSRNIQLLVVGSDDGTVKVFDEAGFLFKQKEKQEDIQQLRRTGRLEQNHVKKDRFFINLTPDEFRPGSRNKKIISIALNSKGILCAGTSVGDIIMWKIDFEGFKKQSGKIYQNLGHFKKHTKLVHFCEFSPNGKLLITGSIDGSAKIWNLEQEKVKKGEQIKPIGLTDERLKVLLEGGKKAKNQYTDIEVQKNFRYELKSPQIDCVIWSTFGRYAIVSVSFQIEQILNGELIKKDLSVIKVWDAFTERLTEDIAKENNMQLNSSSTFVLATHPIHEEILLTGSQGGQVMIWNLKAMKLVKQFVEYGIYAMDRFTFADPYDGKFSPDGSCFVIGNDNGTISLYSEDGVFHKYESTRVDQFFIEDNTMHDDNIYDKYEQVPQICNFNLIPYENQPCEKYIGKFAGINTQSHEEYERELKTRTILSKQEEEFMMNQLKDDEQGGNYNRNQQLLYESESEHEWLEQEEQKAVNQRRRGRVNRQQEADILNQEFVERNRRENRFYDPDNSLFDRESDENFEIEEEDGNDSSVVSDVSEVLYVEKRENYHQQQRKREQEEAIHISSRYERAQRRQQLRQQSVNSDNEEEEEMQINTRQRRKVINSEDDQDMSNDYAMSDCEKKRKSRKMDSSDEDVSFANSSDDEEDEFSSKQRQRHSNMRNQNGVKTRQRTQRIVRSQQNSDVYMEEEKGGNKRRLKLYADIEESKDDSIEIIPTLIPKPKKNQKYDEDYELVNEIDGKRLGIVRQQNSLCEFCQRSDDYLLGPFCKLDQSRLNISEGPFFFHQECIEINLYSKYDTVKSKWVGIGKALEILIKKPQTCIRCNKEGATIQCGYCNSYYHGYYCSSIYLIDMGNEIFQCFDCRNKQNHHDLNKPAFTDNEKRKSEYQNDCKKIKRDHLLTGKYKFQGSYMPQIGDQVYYFYQGHEDFLNTYNCFFYCGDSTNVAFEFPWKKYPKLKDQATLCKVVNISYQLPSILAIHLLKKYGRNSNSVSEPQILTQIEVEIINKKQNQRFSITIFPNLQSEFIVLQNVFEKYLNQFLNLMNNNEFIGKSFALKNKQNTLSQKLKVIRVQPKEQSLQPNSYWQTIQCQKVQLAGRQRRGRDEEDNDEPVISLNFWDLDLIDVPDQEFCLQNSIFAEDEKQRLTNVINGIIGAQGDKISPYVGRVTDDIASDYRCFVSAEMYLQLIITRLQNNYYRSQDQLFFDLDLISYNAKVYNGTDDQLSKNAVKLMEKLRCEMRKQINTLGDRKKEDEKINHKMAGKLTAPVYQSKLTNSMSSMDVFMKQLDECNVQNNNIGRQRASLEETKVQNKIPYKNEDQSEEDESCYIVTEKKEEKSTRMMGKRLRRSEDGEMDMNQQLREEIDISQNQQVSRYPKRQRQH